LAIIAAILTVGPFAALAAAGTLADDIAVLERDYRDVENLAQTEEALGVALGKAGETWNLAAKHAAGLLDAVEAQGFLDRALADYRLSLAGSKEPMTVQLSGLNLMYQSVDVLAYVLAASNHDRGTMDLIKETEKRVVGVAGEPGGEGPALPALTGGIMTMTAIIAGQLGLDSDMAGLLAAEFDRRRTVDENIARLTDVSPERRILLLFNNHLQGTLSMIQVVGLTRAPDLRDKLGRIEKNLINAKDRDLEDQIVACAQAITEAGFLVAPTFGDLRIAPTPVAD
jgi:hypothetical protein